MSNWLMSWEFLGVSGLDWFALAFIIFLILISALTAKLGEKR